MLHRMIHDGGPRESTGEAPTVVMIEPNVPSQESGQCIGQRLDRRLLDIHSRFSLVDRLRRTGEASCERWHAAGRSFQVDDAESFMAAGDHGRGKHHQVRMRIRHPAAIRGSRNLRTAPVPDSQFARQPFEPTSFVAVTYDSVAESITILELGQRVQYASTFFRGSDRRQTVSSLGELHPARGAR